MSKFSMFCGAMALAVTASAFAPAAQAKVYSIPSEDAVATINVSDKWQTNETDNGVELTTEDGGVYVDIEGVKADDIKSAVEDTVKVLGEQGLDIDLKSEKTSDEESNGLKLHHLSYTGKDKDGPTNFAVTLVETGSPDKWLIVTFWGNDEAIKANAKDIADMIDTVQLTKH